MSCLVIKISPSSIGKSKGPHQAFVARESFIQNTEKLFHAGSLTRLHAETKPITFDPETRKSHIHRAIACQPRLHLN